MKRITIKLVDIALPVVILICLVELIAVVYKVFTAEPATYINIPYEITEIVVPEQTQLPVNPKDIYKDYTDFEYTSEQEELWIYKNRINDDIMKSREQVIEDTIDSLPLSIQTLIEEKELQFVFVKYFEHESEIIERETYTEEIAAKAFITGEYCHSEKTIYLRQNIDCYNLRNAILHEIGHFVDENILIKCNGKKTELSQTEYFNQIKNQEYDGSLQENNYHHFSSVEYFADMFADYYFSDLTSAYMKEHCPLTVAYWDCILQEYENHYFNDLQNESFIEIIERNFSL